MLATKRVEIAGKSYVLQQLGTSEGIKVLARVSKVLGPAFGAALKTMKATDEVSLANLGAAGVGDLIAELTQRIEPDELSSLCDLFAGKTEVITEGGGQIPLTKVYYTHFMGDFGALLLLLKEHIEFNFGSFFKGLGPTAPRA